MFFKLKSFVVFFKFLTCLLISRSFSNVRSIIILRELTNSYVSFTGFHRHFGLLGAFFLFHDYQSLYDRLTALFLKHGNGFSMIADDHHIFEDLIDRGEHYYNFLGRYTMQWFKFLFGTLSSQKEILFSRQELSDWCKTNTNQATSSIDVVSGRYMSYSNWPRVSFDTCTSNSSDPHRPYENRPIKRYLFVATFFPTG